MCLIGRSSFFPLFLIKIFVLFLNIEVSIFWIGSGNLIPCNVKFRGFSDSYQKMELASRENTRDLEIFWHKLDLCRIAS